MKQSIADRELVALDGDGVLMRGTYHKPRAAGGAAIRLLPGIMFLNSLLTPRAAFGDTAVRWAESFARRGYPCFRFDLPGQGDSDGETPTELLDFMDNGGYNTIAHRKAAELVKRYHLNGLILVGHCAAATPVVHAAAHLSACKGLIIMDSYFHKSSRARTQLVERLAYLKRFGLGGVLRGLRDQYRITKRRLLKDRLPSNANLALLEDWKRVARRGMPALVLRARDSDVLGHIESPGQFDYHRYLLSLGGLQARIDIKVVDDTDHCFANDGGRAAVEHYTEQWLSEYFPLVPTQVAADPIYT